MIALHAVHAVLGIADPAAAKTMKPKQYFEGKTALITGGSSGIGLATARKLFSMGASVTLLARDADRLASAAAEIEAPRVGLGQTIHTLPADVADEKKLAPILQNYVALHGTPFLLFNAAGVARPGYVQELDLDVFRWTMDIDYHGTVNMTKLLLPGFLERGSGHIINFSSLAGVVGMFGYTAYSGAKFAVRGFSDALRSELKPRGIRVSVVYPPDTDTPQLHWENQYKPYETSVIAGSDKPISAEIVADSILTDSARGKYAIVPGLEAKVLYQLVTRLGNWVYPVIDMLVASARKKKNASSRDTGPGR